MPSRGDFSNLRENTKYILDMQSTKLSLCLLLLLTACSDNSLQALRSAEQPHDPYYRELSRLYLTLAETESRAYDWESSEYFANKGLNAAYGHEVERADYTGWNIPPAELEAIRKADALFDQLVTDKTRREKPLFSAQAQVYYDCWLEQAEETWNNKKDMRPCQKAFFDALGAIQQFDFYYKKSDALKHWFAKVATPVISTSYLVFFGWNEAALNAEAMKVAETVIRDYRAHGKAEVVLNGHADKSGGDEYNLALSQKRAEAVKAYLIKAGIPSNVIKIFAFGETDPKTASPAREKSNRRVEVFLE